MVFFGTVGLVVGGWMLGFITAISLFGWMIGFDVHALTWLWGSWGEEDTERELARLGDNWYVRHDIANDYGNWDHVAVGPPGVFMVESKRLSGRRIEIERDGLSSGRLHFGGKTFRGASAGLRDALFARRLDSVYGFRQLSPCGVILRPTPCRQNASCICPPRI
jgi:hypothetical protein